ncbi:unnamed protein product, partial [Ixodes pacificus]
CSTLNSASREKAAPGVFTALPATATGRGDRSPQGHDLHDRRVEQRRNSAGGCPPEEAHLYGLGGRRRGQTDVPRETSSPRRRLGRSRPSCHLPGLLELLDAQKYTLRT